MTGRDNSLTNPFSRLYSQLYFRRVAMCVSRTLVLISVLCFATAVQAGIIALHTGKADPEDEGFSPDNSSYVDIGPVGPGETEYDTEDAWKINNEGSERTFYRKDLTSTEASEAMTLGWIMNARLHVTDASNPADNSRTVNFVSPGDSPIGKSFLINFGSDGNGNPIVELGADSVTLTSGGYHDYSLVYYPATSSASLFIDGSSTASLTGYMGGIKPEVFEEDSFVRFGSLSGGIAGSANYSLARFESIPEPSTLVLLVLGGVGLLIGSSRARLRQLIRRRD